MAVSMGGSVGDITATLKLNSKQFERETRRVLPAFSRGVSKAISSVGRSLKYGTIALTAYGAASTKAFANFEDAIVRSAAVTTGAVGEMREEMEKAALAMSKRTVLSATELAEGYFALGQAGFNAAQSMKALPVVTEFAIASQLKLDTSTRYLIRTLEGLGMASADPIINMQQMKRVSDVFTFAAIKTTAEIRDFAVAMTHAAAPALRLVNKSMEEGTSVLMAFARAGIVGEEAGTLLWTTVRDLQRASIKARRAWKELGLEIYDSQGRMRNLAEIFSDLESKFGGMTDEGKKVNLMLLGFQDRSLRGIQALMGFSDQMKEFQESMETAGGLTNDLSKKYMESFKSQLKIVWHFVKDVSIAVGAELAPAIEDLGKEFERNQDKIKAWAVFFAKKIASGITELKHFIKFMMDDWKSGIDMSLKISLELFKAFSSSAVVVLKDAFIYIGKNMFAWIEEGLLLGAAIQKRVSIEFLEKFPIAASLNMSSKRRKAETAKIREALMTDLGPDYFKQVIDTEPIMPFSVDTKKIKKIMSEARKEIDKIRQESGYETFKQAGGWLDEWKTFGGKMVKEIVAPWEEAGGKIVQKLLKLNDAISKELGTNARVQVSMDKLRAPLRAMTEDLKDQSKTLGMTSNELAKYNVELNLTRMLEEEFGERDLWKEEELAAYNEELAKQIVILEEILEKGNEFESFWFASKQWIEDASKLWENLGDDLARGMDSFADTLTEQLIKGKADWKGFMASLLTDWLKTIVKMQMADLMKNVLNPLINSIGSAFANAFAGGAASGAAGAVGSAVGFAKGGVLSSGRLIPMASGGLVDTASLIPMANGNTALAGEAGPEAVMPLQRNSQGKLGIIAENPPITVRPKYKFVTVFSTDDLAEAMKTDPGEEAIMNVVRRNRLG